MVPATIGPYRIDREIGRGGMGVVFLGRDTRLDRAVAIKSLPLDVAADPDRLQRFEREAKVLASLSHPNIAAIYGVEESAGARYLILEHVEGQSLAERLARGPMPLADTLDICHQIAAGLEAAHEGGIIHRDLKPGNVMITPHDVVKVLDFGLAKGKVASDSDPAQSPTIPSSHSMAQSPVLPQSPTIAQSPTLPHSPTFHSPATMPGVILGTAAYLSPEQARGKPVDRRTDIWSFGCVLYECLTGRLAFEGETVSDTIAKILERDVDWSRLPRQTPEPIRALLHRCLEKDAKKRLRDIGDARLAIEELRAGRGGPQATVAAAPVKKGFDLRGGVLFGLGIILGAALAINLWGKFGPGSSGGARSHGVTRVSVSIPEDIRALSGILSPDGRTFLILGQPRKSPTGDYPQPRLYARRMDETAFRPLAGTEGVVSLTFSEDGKWVLFLAPISERTTQRQLSKVPLDGSSPPVPVVKADDEWDRRPIWLASGDILMVTSSGRQYVRIPADGGAPSKPLPLSAPGFEGEYTFRKLLPGDRGVLFTATSYQEGVFQIAVGALDLKSGKAKILLRDAGFAEYSPTGHLLFSRRDALLAVPFDLNRLVVKGSPVALQGGLRVNATWGNAEFKTASDGSLLYVSGGNVGQNRRAVIVDADGKTSDWSGERQPFEADLSASPDGTRFASVIADAGAIYEIWVSYRGQTASRRVVGVPGVDCSQATWSPDGTRFAYSQIGRGDVNGIYMASADASAPPRRLVKSDENNAIFPNSWSPDGSELLLTRVHAGKFALLTAPATSLQEVEAKPVFRGPASYGGGFFSPDGRMIAYVSDETGKFEVFVSAWDRGGPAGQPLVVSQGGVQRMLNWSRDGKRVYFLTPQNQIMSSAIVASPRLGATVPAVAWDLDALRVVSGLIDFLPGGRLLAIQKGEGEDEITRFDLALNYFDELKAKLRGAAKK